MPAVDLESPRPDAVLPDRQTWARASTHNAGTRLPNGRASPYGLGHAEGQSHGANVALRGLPGKMPPMFRTVRCHACPHVRRRHVMTWALVFSMARLATMSWGFGPQSGHTVRVAVFVASATIAIDYHSARRDGNGCSAPQRTCSGLQPPARWAPGGRLLPSSHVLRAALSSHPSRYGRHRRSTPKPALRRATESRARSPAGRSRVHDDAPAAQRAARGSRGRSTSPASRAMAPAHQEAAPQGRTMTARVVPPSPASRWCDAWRWRHPSVAF